MSEKIGNWAFGILIGVLAIVIACAQFYRAGERNAIERATVSVYDDHVYIEYRGQVYKH